MKELPRAISIIDLPESVLSVHIVYLWRDRLFTENNWSLYVYSLIDLTSPAVTYWLGDIGHSALITDNHLFVGGASELHIFEVTSSLTKPLIPVTKIPVKGILHKILRVGDDFLLG
jgi:hypothetical protein